MEVGFHGRVVGEFRADILVEECIIVEIKAATRLTNAHEGQIINYSRKRLASVSDCCSTSGH